MKILLLGSSGFIGKSLKTVLASGHEVYSATREPSSSVYIDLLKPETISAALKAVRPQVIINSAGIVDNSEAADQNPVFTANLLESALASGLRFERIIISGSAAEYGLVDAKDIPVSESTRLNAAAGYGLSKLKETQLALKFRQKHNLPIIIARIFNPIGTGMHPRFLIPRIISQIKEFKEGNGNAIEITRLDSKRDYIDVADVALAIKAMIDKPPTAAVYNVGSGISTSNGELVELILKASELSKRPKIVETTTETEPLVATQADITLIKKDLGWQPQHKLVETIKRIVNAAS